MPKTSHLLGVLAFALLLLGIVVAMGSPQQEEHPGQQNAAPSPGSSQPEPIDQPQKPDLSTTENADSTKKTRFATTYNLDALQQQFGLWWQQFRRSLSSNWESHPLIIISGGVGVFMFMGLCILLSYLMFSPSPSSDKQSEIKTIRKPSLKNLSHTDVSNPEKTSVDDVDKANRSGSISLIITSLEEPYTPSNTLPCTPVDDNLLENDDDDSPRYTTTRVMSAQDINENFNEESTYVLLEEFNPVKQFPDTPDNNRWEGNGYQEKSLSPPGTPSGRGPKQYIKKDLEARSTNSLLRELYSLNRVSNTPTNNEWEDNDDQQENDLSPLGTPSGSGPKYTRDLEKRPTNSLLKELYPLNGISNTPTNNEWGDNDHQENDLSPSNRQYESRDPIREYMGRVFTIAKDDEKA